MKRILYLLSFVLLFTACNDDLTYNNLSPEQRELVGTAVNFDMSKADAFQTRTTYNDNGVFNEGDMMVIYRQYAKDDGSFDWQTEVFRNYQYKYTNVPGTEVMLKRDWEVYVGRKKGDYTAVSGTTGRTLTNNIEQTKADSITWENGKTVRFRSWSRSNLSGALGSSKANYYPDYCVSDWVTVSGPTESIPMTLKHLGSRIYFSVRNSGNVLKAVEICTDEKDYKRDDNADTNEHDTADKTIKDENGNTLTAAQAVANVRAAYNRMAMPAGVDIETGLLTAMTQDAYKNASDADIRNIENWAYEESTSKLVFYGAKNSKDVASDVQHPLFASNNTHFALVSIPYDISSEHGGEPITLPPYTRFKITLQDVSQSEQNESQYHIFSLSDIKANGVPVYPKGMEMHAGYSFQFNVGYRYNTITIEPGDSFSWEQQDKTEGTATDETVNVTDDGSYTWWKTAIREAIEHPKIENYYNPEFHISTVKEFLEFIKLVNGEAGKAQTPIYRLVQEYDVKTNDVDGTISKTPKTYGWSSVNDQEHPQFIDRSILEAQGYVFYEHYHPSDATRDAYSEEDYLRGPYSFYDEELNRHFKVVLDADLDFMDQKINSIGKETITFGDKSIAAAFKGVFDGYGDDENEDDETKKKVHTLKNLNVDGYYLFNYVMDAAISNLKIETVHTVGLVNKAAPTMNSETIVGWGCYISGISVKANNQVAGINAIAHELTGPSCVVGCIHDGDASPVGSEGTGGALVGKASDLRMYGCMRTSSNLTAANVDTKAPALLGAYADNNNKFFKPQIPFSEQLDAKNYSKKPDWGNFMCNYYNKDEHEDCKNAVAVANIPDDYSMLEYIRGRQSRILRAYNDNMLNRETPYDLLSERQIEEFYGLAPWKAMTYAIYKYNKDDKGKDYPCMVHYKVKALGNGYDHTYPQMLDGKPGEEAAAWDVLKQSN